MGITKDTWIWSDPPMNDFRGKPDERYLDALEKRIDAHVLNHEIWDKINRDHAALRRQLLAEGPPRSTCPGCFLAIHAGAAEQGWCCDCMPKRSHYEKQAYGY